VEYFLLYFMTVNIVESAEEMKKYLKYGALIAVGVTIYAYYYYFNSGAGARTTAPFEAAIGKVGDSEPASLGGYYLIILGILIAMLTEYGGRALLLALSLIAFMIPAFLLTFSRSSYIGFSFMVLFMTIFSRRRKFFLIFILLGGVLAAFFAPGMMDKVRERVTMTYQGVYATNTINLGAAGSLKLEESAAQRVNSLRRVIFERLPKHPLLGWGVTGIGIGDTQYSLVLGELGLIGFFAFVWMLVRLFSTAAVVYKRSAEPWIRAVAFGFISSLVGLLFQSVGVNSFIITRIMEPFWFLAALIMVFHSGIRDGGRAEPAAAGGRI
jgi:O-antigen ligase